METSTVWAAVSESALIMESLRASRSKHPLQIKQAEAGQAGFFEQLPRQELPLQMRDLLGSHFLPRRPESTVHLRAHPDQFFFQRGVLENGEHLLFEHGQPPLYVFEVQRGFGLGR